MSDAEIAGRAAGLLAMMDAVEASDDCRRRRAHSFEQLRLSPASRVIDVGCGAGTAVIELAALGQLATGFDISEGLLAVARARAERASLSCSFIEASVESLPVEAESIDGYRAERLFQHLREPAAAFGEARRALRRGGRIAIVDLDWDGALIDSDDLPKTRALLRMFADSIPRATVGRQLHGLLSDHGFSQVEVRPDFALSTDFSSHRWFIELLAALGAVFEPAPREALDRWIDEQRSRGERGRFCAVLPWVVATATR